MKVLFLMFLVDLFQRTKELSNETCPFTQQVELFKKDVWGLNTSFIFSFFFVSPIENQINMLMNEVCNLIGEDNMKDDDELTAGKRKRRSCYFCF